MLTFASVKGTMLPSKKAYSRVCVKAIANVLLHYEFKASELDQVPKTGREALSGIAARSHPGPK